LEEEPARLHGFPIPVNVIAPVIVDVHVNGTATVIVDVIVNVIVDVDVLVPS